MADYSEEKRKQIIQGLVPLVKIIASRFKSTIHNGVFDIEDLFMWGIEGLIQGVDKNKIEVEEDWIYGMTVIRGKALLVTAIRKMIIKRIEEQIK